MTFDEILAQVLELLQRQGRVSYRALKLRFDIGDDYIEGLKDELIYAQQVAVDEDDRVLVRIGEAHATSESIATATQSAQPELTQDSQPDQADSTPVDTRPPDAERRQLTILFCDLVESTALSEQLDPEDLREVVRAYQETAAEVIQRYEGHIAQYLGDGLLVYFGWPKAHEDDAQRAVYVSLEIPEAMGTLNRRLKANYGIELAVRMGIHTGAVVVGEMGGGGRHENLALGETPNIAARLEGLAQSNTTVISPVTAQLVQRSFVLKELGLHNLKGVTKPMLLSCVVGPREEQTIGGISAGGLASLVGRAEEVGLLRRCWAQSKEGLRQVVLISGEPGIGKSRLSEALRAWVAQEGTTPLRLWCSPYTQNTALHPVVEHLQQRLQFEPDEAPETKVIKLKRFLAAYQFPQANTVPLIAALLSLPPPPDAAPLTLSPQQQRLQTYDALVAWLCEDALRQPVLLLWEDLHWIDPSSLELLRLLMAQAAQARICILLTARPEFTPPWDEQAHVRQLALRRLDRQHVVDIVANVTGDRLLPDEILELIATKTDGIPLFVEEFTKTILASDVLRAVNGHYEQTGPLSEALIPMTLQDALMARLDRLGSAKGVAQVAAVIGREFSADLLQAMMSREPAVMQRALDQLVAAELMTMQTERSQVQYQFKHALIQDTAYGSLLRRTRQQVHQQVAEVLVTQFPETVERQPELVAHHFTEAQDHEHALGYWHQAGIRATERSANLEAISHFTKGLEVLSGLPDTAERSQHELMIYIALGSPLLATKGYAASEVEHTYRRAQELCVQLGETPHIFPALYGMGIFYLVRGECETAHTLSSQALHIAQQNQDVLLLPLAHTLLGVTLFFCGELVTAREHLEQGIALYDFDQHHTLAFSYGDDPGAFSLAYLSVVLWLLGYPDQALQKSNEAVVLARRLAYPFSLAAPLVTAAVLSHFRRDEASVESWAETLVDLSTEQCFAHWLAAGTIQRGWAMAHQGHIHAGTVQMRQGLAAWCATGAKLVQPYWLAMLAETYGLSRQPDQGLLEVDNALVGSLKNGEPWWNAHLYWLKGELLLSMSSDTPTEAETCLHQALSIARRQQAKSLELRAVTSLARLWQSQDKRQDAYDLLTPVYGWFTEGFGTADLQEAKALLDELGE